ncbi:rho guanine nucleotide exchange factor TIAM1-like [Stigmatopora nigra]
MGNAESRHGAVPAGYLSRKRVSRSLRLPERGARRRASSGKAERGNSEASTRSSSTPSIPRSSSTPSVPRSLAPNSPRPLRRAHPPGSASGPRGEEPAGADSLDEEPGSHGEGEGAAYGAFTLPCRRSRCLSEGRRRPVGLRGRRARTIQDIAGGGEDADGATEEEEAEPRRHGVTSTSSSSAGEDDGACRRGVYENFLREEAAVDGEIRRDHHHDYENLRRELEMISRRTEKRSWDTPPPTAAPASRGTVRKAGRLAVKNFLVRKKNKKVESAARRKWKSYWVSLKGCTLYLYETDGGSGMDAGSVPKRAVWAENAMAQALPEHPKKDFVFCLSNSLGDAFLFQTCSQTELENWITALHSACAAATAARHHWREDTPRLLRAEIKKLERRIDVDQKMKKMGEMQLAAVADGKKRKTILDQIFLWEQNLERFHVELFRLRCYLASLQGGELPNPKRLLAFASRPTKLAMGRLGIFSVSSFHALVAARVESGGGGGGGGRRRAHVASAAAWRSYSKRKSRFSSLWGLDGASKKKGGVHGGGARPSIQQVFADGGDELAGKSSEGIPARGQPPEDGDGRRSGERWAPERPGPAPSWVCLPDDRPVLTGVRPGESALCLLESVCKAHELDPTKHYLRLKFLIDDRVQFYIPKPEEDVCDLLYKEVELCPKISQVLQFERDQSCVIGYGFSISVVEEDGVQQLYVTEVRAGGLAFAKGLSVRPKPKKGAACGGWAGK